MQKLYLLDAYALIYRAYYAFIKNPRINSRGENTSAILGFVNTLEDVLQKEQPTHLGVAFDPAGGTFRHEAYPLYKAQREETPEAIRFAVPYIKKVLEAYKIPILEVPGYEADDVIGTLSHQADLQGIATFMMTPDKDYGQLVTENVRMYRPGVGKNEAEVLGPAEVCKKWGLERTEQVIDMLGLMGDAVDNIPGCPGVGEKTACKLINQFGSIENMLDRTNELKGALKEKVVTNVEQIKNSKWLATIKIDVPITLDMAELEIQEPDYERLKELYSELEFRNLINRKLAGKKEDEKTSKSSPTAPVKNSDGSMQQDMFAMFEEGASNAGMSNNQGATAVAAEAEPPFHVEGDTLVGHDLKSHWKEIEEQGLAEMQMFDTMIAHYLLHPEMRHNVEYLKEVYQCPTINDLRQLFEPELKEKNLWSLFTDIEMPLMPVLADMEKTGVCLDTAGLKETSQHFTQQLARIEDEIHQMAGLNFNIASPKQVGEVLFDHLKISSKAKKTKTGQYVTSEEVLESFRADHPIVGKILEHRGLKKLLGTYIDALPLLINPETGHIHTSFNQTVTATGRLSSSNPNLQNIPVRDAMGKEVRKAFIPETGQSFFSADYSQIELRIMAHLSQDENLIEAFNAGHDIHAATAAKIFKKPIEDVTSDERRKAKTANFGIIYGISAFGLAERMGVSRTEAKQLIDEYFVTYPGVKEYMNRSIEMARETGYTETIFHRRCYLPDINSHNAVVRGYAERNAINSPIQGSAADIIKIAMIRIHHRMKAEGLRSKMILQVHDELNFSVLPEEKEQLQRLVIEEMQAACQMRVPLIADSGWGSNWLEAH